MSYLAEIRQTAAGAIRTGAPGAGFADVLRAVAAGGAVDPQDEARAARLAELAALGLVDSGPGGFRLASGLAADAVLPLAGLMDRLPLALVPLASAGCPVAFCAGFVDLEALPFAAGTGRMIAVGQGPGRAGATLACLGEMAERLAVLSRGADEPLVTGHAASDVAAEAVLGFSARQVARLVADNPALARWCEDGRLRWEEMSERRVLVTRLADGAPALAASLVCLLREGAWYNVPDIPLVSSSGSAAWRDREGALERAVLELVERDAVAVWWYNRLVPPRLDAGAAGECLPADLAAWLAGRERRTHFLVLPTDLAATVVAAVSRDRAGGTLAWGFKAALEPERAVEGAALELVQMEMHLQNVADRRAAAAGDGAPHPLLALSRSLRIADHPWLAGSTETGPLPPGAAAWPELVDSLAASGIAVFAFEATRPELAVPTVRAISPELREWAPRFAPGRLFRLPVALGLRRSALDEDGLNPLHFVT